MPGTTTLKPNVAVSQKVPTISITGMATPGRYVFQLVVTDDARIESDPETFVVTVTKGQ